MGRRKNPPDAPRGIGRRRAMRIAARCPSCNGELLWAPVRGCACGWKPGVAAPRDLAPPETASGGSPSDLLESVEG